MAVVFPYPLPASGYPQAPYVQADLDVLKVAVDAINTAGIVTSIAGTTNQVVASAATGAVTLSLPQSIAAASTPTFASMTLTATTNQLVLGTTRTVTFTAPTPATSSRVVTFPDLIGDYSVVGTIGTQTIGGLKTFSSDTTFSGAVVCSVGAVGTPSVSFGSGNGIYRPAANQIGFATNSKQAVLISSVTGADATTSIPLHVQSGIVGTDFSSQTTTAIAGVATTIITIGDAAILFVVGSTAGGADLFTDMVFAGDNAPSVISSHTNNGAPSVRTYSNAGGNVKLAMSAGTYTTNVLAFDIARR